MEDGIQSSVILYFGATRNSCFSISPRKNGLMFRKTTVWLNLDLSSRIAGSNHAASLEVSLSKALSPAVAPGILAGASAVIT